MIENELSSKSKFMIVVGGIALVLFVVLFAAMPSQSEVLASVESYMSTNFSMLTYWEAQNFTGADFIRPKAIHYDSENVYVKQQTDIPDNHVMVEPQHAEVEAVAEEVLEGEEII